MTRKERRNTKPRPDDRNKESKKEASGSEPVLEPSANDAIRLLRRWNLKALSVLAVLAEYSGAISGSQSLGIFCPNSTGENSDLDIYLPAVQEAAYDAIHVLRSSRIRWDNFLSARIEDVRNYGVTIVPYWTIYETANMLKWQNYEISEVREYLVDSLPARDPRGHTLIESFVKHFTVACENVHDPQVRATCPDNVVWWYEAGSSQFCLVPDAISKKIDSIFKALESRYGQFGDETKDGAIGELGGPNSDELKKSWEDDGYPLGLLQEYMYSRVRKERRQYSRVQVSALVNESLNLGSSGVERGEGKSASRFRILQGTLPDGKNLQLIFVPTYEGGIVATVLKFYASHVMSFVSGTMAAHLYYSDAKARKGIIWDFKDDPRQGGAEIAIKKYEDERKWTFSKADETTVKPRLATDEDVKFISLKDCYTSALQERNTNATLKLPEWWEDYFSKREEGFRCYGWREDRGKISMIQRRRIVWVPNGLLEWVHDALPGHEDVLSRSEWEKGRDDKRSVLDLWFGRVRTYLPPAFAATNYNRML